MKKILFILLIFIPLSLNAQWEILNEGINSWINTIYFVNENVGWLAGYGCLIKTTDSGDNWANIPVDEGWDINQLDFLNESVGWAIVSMCNSLSCYGIISKTEDGGLNWTIQKQVQDLNLYELQIIDENNVFAIGDMKIYKTTNGGTAWNDISPNLVNRNYNSLWFQNSEIGVVVGNYNDGVRDRGLILKTTNGGSTWNQTVANEFNGIFELQFLDSTNGYFKAYNDSIRFLCKTDYMFSDWEVKTQSRYGIGPYQYIDSNNVYAIIADSINYNNLMKSLDGGKTWQNVSSFDVPNVWINNIYFLHTNTGFILGRMNGGYILLRTNDIGLNWIIKNFSYPLKDLYFSDKNNGFIVGGVACFRSHCMPDGRILETANGGLTWELRYSTGFVIQSCYFVNDNSTYCLSGGNIYKSTSNWGDWERVYENNPDSLAYYFSGNDISFLNENIGWAVGKYSVNDNYGAGILGTSDGGKNWNLIWKYPDSNDLYYNLYSLSSVDTSCWAVGESGLILKYTPQNGWIKKDSLTDLPLRKVLFLDDNNGWITGGYINENGIQSIVLRTTNGGESWATNKNLNYLINDLRFLTNQHGWAVGYDSTYKGVILETKDGGNNWEAVVDNLSAQLNSIFIKDNYAWAVGDYGLILRTTNAGPTWVENENQTLPTAFRLEQNYPNPFNPNTKIKYSVPQSSQVVIKVFDVLGNEIEILVNEKKPVGTYELNWNSANLSSGVYIYKMQAGDFIQTKKMILLK